MNRLWTHLYPEYLYFERDPELRDRVKRVMLSKKFGAKSHILRRVLFFALPGFVLYMIAHSYVLSNPIIHHSVDQWILAAAFLGVCAVFAFVDRNAARRNIRCALVACGVPVCLGCGYDLASTDPSTTCPECGTPYPVMGSSRQAKHNTRSGNS